MSEWFNRESRLWVELVEAKAAAREASRRQAEPLKPPPSPSPSTKGRSQERPSQPTITTSPDWGRDGVVAVVIGEDGKTR
jgi:hypothetical protein